MRLKLLLTAGIVLFLSTFASSNECARYTGKCGAQSGQPKPSQPAKSSQQEKPSQPARSSQPAKPAAAPRAVTADTESSTLVINKLLYI